MQTIKGIIDSFSARPETEAIALGGSRASGMADHLSDYDIYIYLSDEMPYGVREWILKGYCSYLEIGNHYWEMEDDCTLHSGPVIEIIYRRIDDFSESLRWVVEGCHASTGYTTCMWDNLLNSRILFDRHSRLAALKDKYHVPYPELLRENILRNNRDLLDGRLPSFYAQVEKAVGRRDMVCVQHRITAFLACYFDIIFAYNRQTYPGEKRLMQLCVAKCAHLPEQFEQNLRDLLDSATPTGKPDVLKRMLRELDKAYRIGNGG